MTLREVVSKYDVSYDTIEKYVTFGFIDKLEKDNGSYDYESENFERLGLIDTLLSAGFSYHDVKKYMTLSENNEAEEEQVCMLKKQRRSLLNDIHEKQQLLDNLDFIIWNKKKKQEE